MQTTDLPPAEVPAKRKPGRPPGPGPRMERVVVRMPHGTMDAIRAVASARREVDPKATAQAVLRAAVAELLEREQLRERAAA
jgi:hypothetical protein